MDSMANIIFNLFLISWEVLCNKLFVGVFSKGLRNIKRVYNLFVLLALMAAEYGIVIVFKDILLIKIFFVILFASIAMCVFYKDRWRRTLILTVFFYGVGFVVDYLVIVLMGRIFSSGFSMNPITSMIMTIIGRIVLLFIILMLKRIIGHESANTLSDIEWMKLLIIPIITMASIIAIVQKFNILQDWNQDQIFLYLAIGMAVMNIDVFYLVDDILQREQKIREAQLYKEQVKNETAWYYSASENLEKQRQRNHEYKNHIACISALVKGREYQDLDEYLRKLDDEMSQRMDIVDTNNVIVNAILNTKYQEIREKGIVLVLRINDLSSMWLEDKDIVVLLTNMLSNAIEACELCKGRKVIKLKAVIEDQQLIIACRNTISRIPIMEEHFFMTTKEDVLQEHGFGIKNMIEVIEKYDGQYVIDYGDMEFYFSIIFSKEQG